VDLGFDTVGNATLICYDRGPLLVTDPWLSGDAYFGSWTLSHEIPEEQAAAARACPFVWVSHGHPDHLSWSSMTELRGRTVLLPDHVGGRIEAALRDDGHRVTVLRDREWVSLSDRVRVCTIADYNQDAILLVDLGGRLIVDLNDATDRGWRSFVRRVARHYDVSFLLQLTGYGDADMINLFDENGQAIPPIAAARRPVGADIAIALRDLGIRRFVPFSSMHQYQREDSVWANDHTTGLDDYTVGFVPSAGELLPAFVRYDGIADSVTPLAPAARPIVPMPPAAFGDDWSDTLDSGDARAVRDYFRSIAHLRRHFARVSVRVGGVEHTVELGGDLCPVSLTFETPRASLMTAVQHRIFDDLLIGNFMRTTVHGTSDASALYPHFTPYVGKYADNGGARTDEEVAAYLAEYRRRAPVGYLRHVLERESINAFRRAVPDDSRAYAAARRVFHFAVAGRGTSPG
jgi:L-ascorbate metabolism protein UlaG (beta-lactamase superfamily)